jgi:hypothetical protein
MPRQRDAACEDKSMSRLACAIALCVLTAGSAAGQDVRNHTRLDPRGTRVTQAQAETLTLTLGTASVRPVQTWIRTAGTIDKTGKILSGSLSGPEAALVKIGQRVRAFSPGSKSSMYQAYVTRVNARGNDAAIEVTLAASGRANTTFYVMEIVVEQGPFLCVPNEAIIEEGDKHIVYIQQAGEYVAKEVRTGIQGELLTQIVDGLEPDAQVVTFGSFFIDAEHKLKGTGLGQ